MEYIQYWIKRLLRYGVYIALVLVGFFTRRTMDRSAVKRVGILFLPMLGIGDLVMLSPIIQKIAEIFSGATITLVTHVPATLSFSGITVERYTREHVKTHNFDLVISPALNLRHIAYIWRARYWLGYFALPRIQSNFGLPVRTYNMRHDHYLVRGKELLTALDEQAGKMLETAMHTKTVTYPAPVTKEPALYKEHRLDKERYIVLGIFSKQEDRQWSFDNFTTVVRALHDKQLIQKVVVTGDSSEHNLSAAKRFLDKLGMSSDIVINATGKCSLPETNFLIAHSHLYLGLDSGPAHLAYLLAPRSVVLFVTVPPALRFPLTTSSRKIKGIYPDPAPAQPLYTGYGPAPIALARKYVAHISYQQVWSAIEEVVS